MTKDTVDYMERSRNYYAAHGYEKSYLWAHNKEIPFSPLRKPLSECKATLITTAMPDESFALDKRSLQIGDMKKIPESFFTTELSWDKDATHTNDIDSFFPVRRLMELVESEHLGSLADHYYCAPTSYSQRQTKELDAEAILRSCIEDQVDIALLVPL